MENYEKGEEIGKGTHGVVKRAICKKTGDPVAIKRIGITDRSEGINMTALREVKLLREVRSEWVVPLREAFYHKQCMCLVFDYVDANLEDVVQDPAIHLGPADVKGYMHMLLQALSAIHALWVVHRDVKPNNLLINHKGEMKLADFGLARVFGSPEGRYTSQVFARWYRPPELLFNASNYSWAVDIWAAGCVMAELLLRRVWLPGATDLDQLTRIFKARGTPEVAWPAAAELKSFVKFQPFSAPPLSEQFPGVSHDALDLLSRLVQLDPNRRPSAEEALLHPYFTTPPYPTPEPDLPRPPANPWAQAIREGRGGEGNENGGHTADVSLHSAAPPHPLAAPHSGSGPHRSLATGADPPTGVERPPGGGSLLSGAKRRGEGELESADVSMTHQKRLRFDDEE